MEHRHMRGVICWAASILLMQCRWCPVGRCQPTQPTDRLESIQVGELRRPYRLHVPPSYDGKNLLPLVLVFHGRFESAEDIAEVTQFSRLADQQGFIVVYPIGIHSQWNDGRGSTALEPHPYDDVGFVTSLIQHLEDTLAVDPSRIYATGMSNGAMFVQRLACELSETLAAIGPVAGTLASNQAPHCAVSQPVSVIEFHGTRDAFVLWHGGPVRVLGGRTLSVPATIAQWQQHDGCASSASRVSYEPRKDPHGVTRVRQETYGPCHGGSEVISYTVEGGGHTWPGGPDDPLIFSGRVNRDLSATEVIWAFFAKHPKPARADMARRTTPTNILETSSASRNRPSASWDIRDAMFQPTFQERVVLSVSDLLSNFARIVTTFSPQHILILLNS